MWKGTKLGQEKESRRLGKKSYRMAKIIRSLEFSPISYDAFWTVVLEKTLESPLGSKEIKPVNPKGNQPWIFIRRIDAEAEVPILWPPDVKSWLIIKDSGAGKDWRQEEKETTEDEMVEWHHWLDGHELEQTLGNSEGQKLGVLQSTGSQGVGHDQVTEQQTQYALVLPWLRCICKNLSK